jgi:hypothetical protein
MVVVKLQRAGAIEVASVRRVKSMVNTGTKPNVSV